MKMNIFRGPSCAETELVPGPARSGALSQNGRKWWSCSGVLASFGNAEAYRHKKFVWRTLYSYGHAHENFLINSWMCIYMYGRHNVCHSLSKESSVWVPGSISISYLVSNHIRFLACSFSAIFLNTHVVTHIHDAGFELYAPLPGTVRRAVGAGAWTFWAVR